MQCCDESFGLCMNRVFRELFGFLIHIWKLKKNVKPNVTTDNNGKLTRDFKMSEWLSRSVLFPMHLLPWIELAVCFDLGISSFHCCASPDTCITPSIFKRNHSPEINP